MDSNRISFAMRLIRIAITIIAARAPDCIGEEMVPVTDYSFTVPEAAAWTQPENRDLTLWLRIHLRIDKEASDRFVAGLKDPASPYYGHWIGPGQAGIDQARRLYGPLPTGFRRYATGSPAKASSISMKGLRC